jgi:hypothetical protein
MFAYAAASSTLAFPTPSCAAAMDELPRCLSLGARRELASLDLLQLRVDAYRAR